MSYLDYNSLINWLTTPKSGTFKTMVITTDNPPQLHSSQPTSCVIQIACKRYVYMLNVGDMIIEPNENNVPNNFWNFKDSISLDKCYIEKRYIVMDHGLIPTDNTPLPHMKRRPINTNILGIFEDLAGSITKLPSHFIEQMKDTLKVKLIEVDFSRKNHQSYLDGVLKTYKLTPNLIVGEIGLTDVDNVLNMYNIYFDNRYIYLVHPVGGLKVTPAIVQHITGDLRLRIENGKVHVEINSAKACIPRQLTEGVKASD